jgi:hypothetical protein
MSNSKYFSICFLLKQLTFFCHQLIRVSTAKMLLAVRKRRHDERIVSLSEKLVTKFIGPS